LSYNSLGLRTGLSDNASRSWTYSYSSADLTGVSDAIGTIYTLTYGDSSNPHSPTILTDASSNAWTYSYNAYGQILTVTPPSGSPTAATTYAYDETSSDAAFGWLASVTDGASDVTTFGSYSPLGDVLSLTTSPSGGVNETVQYTYDALRRLRQVTNPDSTTESYTFTGRDLTSIEDEASTVSDFTYCPTCGKLTGANYPLSKGLVWNLNSDFELTSFVDANNHSTSYTLGNAGELKYFTYPDSLQYIYSGYRRPGEPVDVGSASTPLHYRYDNAGRTTGISFNGGSSYPISYTFRADDLPSAVTDQVGTRTLSYLSNRWLQSASYDFSGNGLSAAQEVDYSYNADGTVSSVTWKNGGTTVASWGYSYDGAGRISSISNSFSETTNFTYDGEGKLLTQSNANGTSHAITYNDSRGWPTLLEEKASGTDFASYSLVYDSGSNTVGNLTGVTEIDSSTMTYGYDALYRLTSEVRAGTNSYSTSYGYDLANNVTTVNGSTFATYDTANKFSTISGGSKTYDGSGNLDAASYSGFSISGFSWDRKFKATGAGTRVNLYTAEGLRGAARATGTGTPNTFYIYDGERIIGEINSSTGTLAAYTWGPAGIVSERLLSGTPKSLWYHFGPQGETRQLTDSSGTVVDAYRYTAYGVPLGTTGSDSNPFQYGGRLGYYTDSSVSGAVLVGQRWYSPGLYRWMSRDPILYGGGDNQYAYVSGNPVHWADPFGLDDKSKDPSAQEPLVPIWICSRPILSPWWKRHLLPNHEYICCQGPNDDCYGHADNELKPKDKIPAEDTTTGECTEKRVTQEEKDAKCNNPRSPCWANSFFWNCRDWAEWDGVSSCPAFLGPDDSDAAPLGIGP
jgi:RHS repeat-associated protein